MNKKFRIILIAVMSSLLLVLGVIGVYAAYTFNKKVTVDGDVGTIDLSDQCFYDYSKPTALTEDNENYLKALKLRNDTVVVVDDITFNYTDQYVLTSDLTFVEGKEYYIRELNTETGNYEYSKAQVMINGDVTSNTYYEKHTTYSSIKTLVAYDSTLSNVANSISTATITFQTLGIVANCTIGQNRLDNVTITTSHDYRCVLNTNGKGFVVLDNEKTVDSTKYTEIESNKVTVSATEKKYMNNVAQNDKKIYLSQLGLHFEFKTDIAVYVRVRIKQQWNKISIMGSTTKNLVGINELANGNSPFLPSGSEWFAQDLWNDETKEVFSYIYLKNIFVPDDPEDIQSYTLNVYEAYYKEFEAKNSSLKEYEDVVVSFDVQIVQANRAKELWGVDPSTFTN